MTDAPDHRRLGLFIQPACLQHKYIRHANASHIFERPERLRAVLLGVAAAAARLEEEDQDGEQAPTGHSSSLKAAAPTSDDLSSMLSSLSIASSIGFAPPRHLNIVPPPLPPAVPGRILLHHPPLQLAHSPPPESSLLPNGAAPASTSPYLKDLFKWASEAVERIKETGCEIPSGKGLLPTDLYLGPGSVLAIEGAVQTVCQAVDRVCDAVFAKGQPQTPPLSPAPKIQTTPPQDVSYIQPVSPSSSFTKAFCAVRPPGHHCGEDAPSGFCYVNNVVVGAMHAYLQHDIDRAIILDFDLHHGNGTQALVMPLNAVSHTEDLAVQGGKPPSSTLGPLGKRRRGWKGFYGSVHDIYSYPCEDGDFDLIKDASISMAAHGQYIENIHLQPYTSEADFYERIYPKYIALLVQAKLYMEETAAEPERTMVFISAGFDACEHEHQAMQRHDRRVPTSFFSRYTRDIVAFADKHTQGKVVSVLEGGYSDRALTSAALGHVLGLLDRPGDPRWWNEEELSNIEKATKRKRNGRLAPFPAEMASLSYLARTHALIGHFEGSMPDAGVSSVATTPQHTSSGRMNLRNQKKPLNGDDDAPAVTTPPVARRGRGRMAATPNLSTPRAKAAEISPSSHATTQPSLSPSRAPEVAQHPTVEAQIPPTMKADSSPSAVFSDQTIDDTAAQLAAASLTPPTSEKSVPAAQHSLASTSNSHLPQQAHQQIYPGLPRQHIPRPAANSETSAPSKIILRFNRPPSQPLDSKLGTVDQWATSSSDLDFERMAYREGSATTTSSDPPTDGEYLTANTDVSSGTPARDEGEVISASEGAEIP